MQTVDPLPTPEATPNPTRRLIVRVALGLMMAGFATFWIWALLFASKEAVNRIDDRAWAARGQQICLQAAEDRLELTDLRSIAEADADLIRERAEIVDRATDNLERMLDDLVAVEPTDVKGQQIVPLWEDDYRTYLQDRRNYADQLRRTGENQPFYETDLGSIPISERISTFAGDNEMSACAPPYDLSR